MSDWVTRRPDAVTRRPDACWGVIGHGPNARLALWPPHERRLHLLSPTAAAVWESIDSTISTRELVDRLARRFDAAPAVIERDIAPLLDRLINSGLATDPSAPDGTIDLVDRSTLSSNVISIGARVARCLIGPVGTFAGPLMIAVDDLQLSETLRPILAPLIDTSERAAMIEINVRAHDDGWIVARDGVDVGWCTTRAHALRTVLGEVNTAPLDHVTDAVVLHASAMIIGTPETGSRVLFPGISNSGKSTLAAQLCLRGHGYLTDEALAIDVDTLGARPFHKSLCIEPSGQAVLPELADLVPSHGLSAIWDVDPRKLEPGYLASGGPIDAVVFPTYTPGAVSSLTPLEPLEALQRLIANAFDFSTVGQPAFATLVELANTTPMYQLVHGGTGAQLVLLESRFGAGSLRPTPIQSRIERRSGGAVPAA